MKELTKIKNYIYGKGIISSLTANSIIGNYKGKRFKIFFSKKQTIKNKPLLNIEINNQLHQAKDSREIVRLLN